MLTALLFRHTNRPDATLGTLEFEGGHQWAVLEPPWRNNKTDLSCIPAGKYLCRIQLSPRYGRVYHVLDVPERTHILLHAGNFPSDTKGCLLIGRQHTTVDGKSQLKSGSRKALQELHAFTGGADFMLEIPQ